LATQIFFDFFLLICAHQKKITNVTRCAAWGIKELVPASEQFLSFLYEKKMSRTREKSIRKVKKTLFAVY
jgi:hypothetical protein